MLVLSLGFLASALVLAWPRSTDGAAPHRVGQGALIAVAALAAILSVATSLSSEATALRAALRWLSFPIALLSLGLGFAWIGRLHRLLGYRRLANLADLAGMVLPLLWAGGQLIGGYPGLELQIPGGLAMLVGATAIAGVALPPKNT